MKYIIIAFVLFVLTGCGKKDVAQKDPGPEDQKKEKQKEDTRQVDRKTGNDLKPYQAIIKTPEKMDWIFGKGYKSWTPSNDDIETAEKLLYDCIAKERTGTVDHLFGRKLEEYNRQFIGAEEENGEKTIYINCFCKAEESSFKDWKTMMFGVADGGNCFFNLKVNITRNVYGILNVNGGP